MVNNDRFLGNYRAMRFEEAAADLAMLRAAPPGELGNVYALYQARLDQFALDPPPPGWDGVFRAEHK